MRFDGECQTFLEGHNCGEKIPDLLANYPDHEKFFDEEERTEDSTYGHYQQNEQG